MCFKKNKKLILLLILVFVVIYLLTKYNENFNPNAINNTTNSLKIESNTNFMFKGGKITNGSILFSNINDCKMINSIINNTRIEQSEINNTNINNPTINNPTINNPTIKIGNNFLTENILAYLNDLYNNSPQEQERRRLIQEQVEQGAQRQRERMIQEAERQARERTREAQERENMQRNQLQRTA